MDAAIAAAGSLANSSGTVASLAAEFHVEWSLIAAQFLNFTVVALLLYRFAIGPLLRTMDERSATIRTGLANAEEASKKLAASDEQCAAKRLEASGVAKEIVDAAKLAADALLAEQRKQVALELSALRKKEAERISRERDSALRDAAKGLSRDAAALAVKIFEECVDDATAAKFSSAAVKAIGSANG